MAESEGGGAWEITVSLTREALLIPLVSVGGVDGSFCVGGPATVATNAAAAAMAAAAVDMMGGESTAGQIDVLFQSETLFMPLRRQ